MSEMLANYINTLKIFLADMEALVNAWRSDMSINEMEFTISKLDAQLQESEETVNRARIEVHQAESGSAQRRQREEIEKFKKKNKTIKKKIERFRQFLSDRKQLFPGGASKTQAVQERVERGQKENYQKILESAMGVRSANEEADLSYQELLNQKNTMNNFGNKVAAMDNHLSIADRYLRSMKSRDQRHRCYVTLMVLTSVVVIAGSAGIIFGT